MCTVSNSPLTKGEFEQWVSAMKDTRMGVVGAKEAEMKHKEIEGSKTRERNHADIKKILEQKRKAGSLAGNSGIRRHQLEHEIDVLEIDRTKLMEGEEEELACVE